MGRKGNRGNRDLMSKKWAMCVKCGFLGTDEYEYINNVDIHVNNCKRPVGVMIDSPKGVEI